MEDVIFAGTSGRPPLGRAEVLLTIDNTDGALPIEYAEVTISRTMFRSGGSEYAINGNPCRLLDVQELLSDSGIGREMHVIVGQGQLDTILHATPEDRRGFIEEAAGVLKHRKRKEKALRKLDSTDGNLHPARRPAHRDPAPAQAARPAGRGRAPGRDRAGRRPRRAGPADGRRPGQPRRPRSSRSSPTRRSWSSAGSEVEAAIAEAAREPRRRLEAALREDLPALAQGPGHAGLAWRAARAAARHPVRWPPSGCATPPPSRGRRRAAAATPTSSRPRPRGSAAEEQDDRRRGRRHRATPSRRPSTARQGGGGRGRRGGAPGRRAAAGRRRPARGTGPAARPGQRAEVPRGCRRGRGRPAGPRPARTPSPAPSGPSATSPRWRPRSPASTPARRASTPSTRRPSPALDDLEERLAKVREEAQQAERDRASLAAREDALELGLNRKDGAGALLAASDGVRAARLGRRPARACAAATRRPSPPRSARPPTRSAVADADAAVGAIGHAQGRRPRARRAAARRRARGRPATGPACPATRRTPWTSSSAPTTLRGALEPAAVQDRRGRRPGAPPAPWCAELPDVTAVTREGDVLGAHFAAGGSVEPAEPDRDAGRGRRGRRRRSPRRSPPPSGSGFDISRLEAERLDAQQRVDVALAKLHESDATLAAVAEELGQYGSQARAGPRRGRAARRGDRAGRGGPRPATWPGSPSSRSGSRRPRRPPRRSPTPTTSERLADAARERPAGRDGGSARRCAPPRSGPGPARSGRLAGARRGQAEREARARAAERRERLIREGRAAEAVGIAVGRRAAAGSRSRCTWPPRPGTRSSGPAAGPRAGAARRPRAAARPRPRARRAGQLRPPRRDGPHPAADADRAARGARARGARPRRRRPGRRLRPRPARARSRGEVPRRASRDARAGAVRPRGAAEAAAHRRARAGRARPGQPARARGVLGDGGAAQVPHRAARGPQADPQGPPRHRPRGRRSGSRRCSPRRTPT